MNQPILLRSVQPSRLSVNCRALIKIAACISVFSVTLVTVVLFGLMIGKHGLPPYAFDVRGVPMSANERVGTNDAAVPVLPATAVPVTEHRIPMSVETRRFAINVHNKLRPRIAHVHEIQVYEPDGKRRVYRSPEGRVVWYTRGADTDTLAWFEAYGLVELRIEKSVRVSFLVCDAKRKFRGKTPCETLSL